MRWDRRMRAKWIEAATSPYFNFVFKSSPLRLYCLANCASEVSGGTMRRQSAIRLLNSDASFSMLNSNPPKEEEKQTKAMLQFFENVISSFIEDQDFMQCIYMKVFSFCSSNKMKISKTNMTFLPFFEKDYERQILCTTTIPPLQSGALALSE